MVVLIIQVGDNNMGKLRKIGRKIKKGVKKLFSSDIGRVVGMIGMFMAMSWAGKAMKGFFKGAETAATEVAAAATEGAAVATEGAAASTSAGAEAVTSEAISATTGGGSGTIMTEANTAVNQINSASVNPSIDASATIDNTVTGSLEKSVDAGVFEQPTAEVNQNLVDIESTNFLSETKGNVMDVQTGTITRPEVGTIDTSAATDLMTAKPEIAFQGSDIAAGPPVESVTQSTEALVGDSKLKSLAANTGERFSNLGQNVKNYFTDGSIVPDTITGVSTGVIMSKLQDEPEMGGGFISPPPMQEMAQGAYMQEIAPVVSSVTGVPNFKNFSDMAQQTIYGVGTPNHLAGLYATPPAPTVNYG